MDWGLPSSSNTKSSLVRLFTILPCLSRTVTGNVTTFTSTESVGTAGAGVWAAGVAGAALEFCDSRAGARRRTQINGDIRSRPMPNLDDTGSSLVTAHGLKAWEARIERKPGPETRDSGLTYYQKRGTVVTCGSRPKPSHCGLPRTNR